MKTCPFCGAEPRLYRYADRSVVECSAYDQDTHRIQVEGATDIEALRRWNHRETGEDESS